MFSHRYMPQRTKVYGVVKHYDSFKTILRSLFTLTCYYLRPHFLQIVSLIKAQWRTVIESCLFSRQMFLACIENVNFNNIINSKALKLEKLLLCRIIIIFYSFQNIFYIFRSNSVYKKLVSS